jgi:hypothetical protein
MTKPRKYNDPDLIAAVKSSTSIAQVLNQLGLKPAGGNYTTIKNRTQELGLDTSHWRGQAWNKGLKVPGYTKRNLQDILVENSPHKQSHGLKIRLINEGLLEEICDECSITNWMNRPLSFHLEHINGVHSDNRLPNLRLLCPNCHSQTPTYCGRNIGKAESLCHWVDALGAKFLS